MNPKEILQQSRADFWSGASELWSDDSDVAASTWNIIFGSRRFAACVLDGRSIPLASLHRHRTWQKLLACREKRDFIRQVLVYIIEEDASHLRENTSAYKHEICWDFKRAKGATYIFFWTRAAHGYSLFPGHSPSSFFRAKEKIRCRGCRGRRHSPKGSTNNLHHIIYRF